MANSVFRAQWTMVLRYSGNSLMKETTRGKRGSGMGSEDVASSSENKKYI